MKKQSLGKQQQQQKKVRREERGEKGRGGKEIEKHAKFSWPKENLNGFGWGLAQPQPCCSCVGGEAQQCETHVWIKAAGHGLCYSCHSARASASLQPAVGVGVEVQNNPVWFDRAAPLCKTERIREPAAGQSHPLGSRDWEGLGQSWGPGAAPTPHLHAGSSHYPTQPQMMRFQTIPPEAAAAAAFGFEFLHPSGTFTRISSGYFKKNSKMHVIYETCRCEIKDRAQRWLLKGGGVSSTLRASRCSTSNTNYW